MHYRVSLILVTSCLTGNVDSASNKPKMITNFPGVIDTGDASFTSINDIGNACIAGVINTGEALLQFARAFKGTVNKRPIYE